MRDILILQLIVVCFIGAAITATLIWNEFHRK